MSRWSDKFALVLITVWVGGLWAIGYLVAPALFQALADNRPLAGQLAGRMFALIAYLGMACAIYLIAHACVRHGRPALKQGVFWIPLAMLGLTLVGHFGIQPILAGLKAQAMPVDVMQSMLRDRFAAWHGVGSILYLIESVLGLLLVIRSR